MKFKACLLEIDGIVQGVGFRPFIYSLAASFDIKGLVYNIGTGVIIHAEGPEDRLDAFISNIKPKAPPLSVIRDVRVKDTGIKNYSDFSIGKSVRQEEKDVFIPPDVAVCEDCERELFDVNDKRYLYPFINCTNCGPRFTIIDDMPYDRINTTMKVFEMCPFCAEEYSNPGNRRFHAQPVSCPDCGPRLRLLDGTGSDTFADDPVGSAAEYISKGYIVAVKGIGGYHLACDALNDKAVRTLRERKHRDEKPFALMAESLETVKKYCRLTHEEEVLLTGMIKPIVLLEKRQGVVLPQEITPLNPYLGMMLPYTPIHLLLFNPLGKDTLKSTNPGLLVMTSGNVSSEPIYFADREAIEGLRGIADYFLVHDREIRTRVDDSVTRVFMNREYIIRRSRGYVPLPVTVDFPVNSGPGDTSVNGGHRDPPLHSVSMGWDMQVLGVGGELKSTFCLSKKNEFYISQHIGDLENLDTLRAFELSISHYSKMLRVKPDVLAYDMHPDYLSTHYALSSSIGIKIPVQHHHAHHVSCMAENGLTGETIGVIFDGTGFGEDGQIWGGEFFTGGLTNVKRAGHLNYIPMPGGEAAVKEPWRMSLSYLVTLFGTSGFEFSDGDGILSDGTRLLKGVNYEKLRVLTQLIGKRINSPLTSSMGRLFDAVSALIGVRNEITYEGQAAIEMEYLSEKGEYGSYDFDIENNDDMFGIDVKRTFEGIIRDMRSSVKKSIIAAKFHETVANLVLTGCERIRKGTDLERVVLSGGVFQNMTLLGKTVKKLENNNFSVYIHSKVPANDGGISLGQAVIAAARIRGGN